MFSLHDKQSFIRTKIMLLFIVTRKRDCESFNNHKEDNAFNMNVSLPFGPVMNTDTDYNRTFVFHFSDLFIFFR